MIDDKMIVLTVAGLREMEMPGTAEVVLDLAAERKALLERAQAVVDRSHVIVRGGTVEQGVYVDGDAFTELEAVVTLLAPARPILTVHQGGSPPARPTKRRVTIPEGDPA